ncbi:transposase, partial [Shigella flexneri]
ASTLKSPSYTKSVSWQHYPMTIKHHCLRNGVFICFILGDDALAVKQRR